MCKSEKYVSELFQVLKYEQIIDVNEGQSSDLRTTPLTTAVVGLDCR